LPIELREPDIVPEPDGSLALNWHRDETRLCSVSVGVDGQLHYSCEYDNNRREHGVVANDQRGRVHITALLRAFMDT
jgi:hypothetical protein